MNISEIRVMKVENHSILKAYVNITFNHALSIKGMRIIQGKERMYVSMPSVCINGKYINKAFPINQEVREEMERYALDAIRIESFDEKIHCYLVKSFMKQGNNTAAIAHYNKATKILLANLGVQPSAELRNLYLEVLKTQKSLETNLDIIIEDLKEAEFQKGAFVCDYGIFKETYKIVTRQAARSNRSVSIVLITVCDSHGELPDLNVLDKVMEKLVIVIRDDLRRGDVVSKYSGAQFVIMLPDAKYKDAEKITERIIRSFYKNNRKSILQFKYKINEIKLDSKSDK